MSTPSGPTLETRLLTAGIAGLVATVPMTTFMEWADQAAIDQPQSSLPPREIVDETAARVSPVKIPDKHLQLATQLAHYGYGATVATLYALGKHDLQSKHGAPLLCGAAFGLEVWLVSYLGLLPAMGSSARGSNQPMRVNLVMILAHAIWGATVGLLTAKLLQASPAANDSQLD